MGIIFTRLEKIFQGMLGKSETAILMLGLDASGKTTVLYKLKLGEIVTTIPTIGFNVESVKHKNISFRVWDVSGRDKIRPLWRHYFLDTQLIILVVDSNDRERFPEFKEEFYRLLAEEELQGIPYLIFANKQDLPNAMTPSEISTRLELDYMKRNRDILVQPSCATTGDGLFEGLEWLSKQLKYKTGRNNVLANGSTIQKDEEKRRDSGTH